MPTALEPQTPTNASGGGVPLAGDHSGMIVLVVASLALGAFEMLQIRKLQGRKGPPPADPKPPQDEL